MVVVVVVWKVYRCGSIGGIYIIGAWLYRSVCGGGGGVEANE